MDTVRLGIIGFGQQGGYYSRILSSSMVPGMSLGAIADSDAKRRQTASEQYPDVPVYDDVDALLASDEVDAVVTTVPHYLHPQLAIKALTAGKHTLVDKPAGVYSKQVRLMNEFAATKPELTFAIMFNQRTNPLYVELKQLLDSGELGALRHWNWIITTWWRPQGYYQQSAWRATWGGEGGGVLVNQAPHQIDLSQWLCGMPKKVFAKLGFGFRRDIAVEDEVVAVFDLGDGATGTFTTSVHDVKGTDRLEILLDKGKVVVDGSAQVTITRLSEDEKAASDRTTPESTRRLFAGENILGEDFITTETRSYESVWGQQHASVLENFAANILHGTPLIAPGSDGINGVRIANAMHLSAFLGREVDIDFDEDEYLRELNARIAAEGKFPQQEA
ncbi:MAG TPA: Gfo/Idh/MocA family oxidoreductase [Propionibacteriaceae bacterium]|nr:Gfo/Idh/MocA family oxidoreductase [Propionibacteriaceae bacterium]